MFSYVTLWYVITPLLSDNSKQGPISICLFTVVRNLQLTFLSNNQEGLKFQRSSRPLTLTIAGSAGDIIYIYILSLILVIPTWPVSSMLYDF